MHRASINSEPTPPTKPNKYNSWCSYLLLVCFFYSFILVDVSFLSQFYPYWLMLRHNIYYSWSFYFNLVTLESFVLILNSEQKSLGLTSIINAFGLFLILANNSKLHHIIIYVGPVMKRICQFAFKKRTCQLPSSFILGASS